MKVFGKNAARETIISSNKIKKIYITSEFKDKDILKLIKDKNLRYEYLDSYSMNKMNPKNQGIMIVTEDYEYTSLEDLLNEKYLIILDHLEDPHNFGAIIRTVEASGIKGIIIPKDRSVDVNDTVMKISTGALNYVKIAKVTNLNNTIKILKDNNFFIYGAEANGVNYKKISYADKVVLVIGSEGNGLSPLVRKNCDEIISLPMKGNVNSLNASNAAAILIYDLIER